MAKTLDDIVEELADKMGIYGAGPKGDHEPDCPCRICFVIGMKDRIREAILPELRDEIAISLINAGNLVDIPHSRKRSFYILLDEFWKVIKGK